MPMKTDLTRPCAACPFRRTSPPGWLGSWDGPGQLLWSLGRTPFPCHLTISAEGQSFDDDGLQGCAGAAIFLNSKLERSRCPETACHQRELAGAPDHVKAEVFANTMEFCQHHMRRKP
jgi:hypothetical protein